MIRGLAPLTVIALLILGSSSMLVLALTVAEILQNDEVSLPTIEWTPKLSTSAERLTSITPLNAYRPAIAHPIFFKTASPLSHRLRHQH